LPLLVMQCLPEFITLCNDLLKARMFSDLLSKINFWGWQLIIVAAAITLPLGYTTSKEYAELEWPIDIAIALFGLYLVSI
jgi:cbb3-type cytochrome oxidase subunit 1